MSRYLLNWRLMLFSFMIVVCSILVVWFIIDGINRANKTEKECAPYSNTPMSDVPAKCVSWWESK